MAAIPQDMLANINKARVGGGGNYIMHGDYVVMTDKWHYQKVQDRCIIHEMIVVEARSKVVYEGDKKIEQEPNVAGSSMSDTVNFDGDGKLSADANVRAPVLGLFDLSENDAAQASKVSETLNYCTGDAQPARGMLQLLSTFTKRVRTPKPGGPLYITRYTYKCLDKPGVGANTPDKVKARLDALARSSEEFLRVAQQHVAESRAVAGTPASNGAPTLTLVPPVSAPPALVAAPAVPTLPSIPVVPWYVAEGWKQHPQDPRYYYKNGENPPARLESELVAMKR